MVLEFIRSGRMKLACCYVALAVAFSTLAGCGGSVSSTVAPVILPAGGTYAYMPVLTLKDATPGALIYYTTDGSTPTTSSALYSSSTFLEINQNATVNAIAVTGSGTSAVASATYTISLPPAPTPVLSPAPGGFLTSPTVTITDSAPGASIYYTTDGSTPTTSSSLYSTPITVAGDETLKAVAISRSYGYDYSAAGGGAYVVLYPPVFSVAAGTYTSTQQLTLSDITPGTSIYYTTDGSTPTTSSTPYTGPISISSTETVSALAAVAVSGNSLTSPAAVSYVIHPPGTSLVLSGTALSGQPVIGASIQLYAVGATGYTSAATPLLTSPLVTDKTGAFRLPGNYTCTPGSYLYVTASGGTTTAGHSQNQSLALAAVLGLCDNLTASSSFTVNEETTVAAAYALAQFSKGSSFGQAQFGQQGGPSSAPADNFATSSTNMVGMANAMSISEILASPSTGGSGNNSNGSALPEWWQMNLIADMLTSCVRSDGGIANDGTSCRTLFGNVVPTGGTAPADTLQAALDLALTPVVPAANIANLYALIPSATAPFQPYPVSAAAITDFSMAIEYQPTGGVTTVLNQPSGIAIDSLGNAWIGNVPHTANAQPTVPIPSFLAELTPAGVPIQAGTTAGTFVVNGYSVSGAPTAMVGQQWNNPANTTPSYVLTGLLVPSIDTNNNVWFNDRANSVVASVPGSGTTYSTSQVYSNGGNQAAVGNSLDPVSLPVATYVDGGNSVWFNLASGNNAPGTCGVGLGGFNSGMGAFLNGNTSNVVLGKTDNAISNTSNGYIVIDPNKTDVVGAGATPIPGAPFVWTLGLNATANLIVQSYTTQVSSPSVTPSCNSPLSAIGVIANNASGSTDTTANPGHSASTIMDTPNPSLSGDYLHFIGYNATSGPITPQDWTFDKFGNLWIANRGRMNTTTVTASQILSALSKVTPAYGNTFNSSSTSNFKFSVYHNVAGMIDGSTVTNYPVYLTTDGAGNVWFAMNNSPYLNAVTTSGTPLSPNGTAASNAGFAGSSCACTFNGAAKTYQRPTTAISRPTVDQSGDIWIPASGVGSAYVDLLVGIAAPRVNPDSFGLKTGTFAAEP